MHLVMYSCVKMFSSPTLRSCSYVGTYLQSSRGDPYRPHDDTHASPCTAAVKSCVHLITLYVIRPTSRIAELVGIRWKTQTRKNAVRRRFPSSVRIIPTARSDRHRSPGRSSLRASTTAHEESEIRATTAMTMTTTTTDTENSSTARARTHTQTQTHTLVYGTE